MAHDQKRGKGGRSKSKKSKERREKVVTKFDGECRYCLKRKHKKSDCTTMKSDIAAGKCDKSGKPIGGQCTPSGRRNAAFTASELCTEHGKHHPLQQMVPVYFQCPDGSQTSQLTETWYINMIVPAQKTLMVASLDGADVLPNQLCQGHPNVAATCKLANRSVECIGQGQVGYRLENGKPFVVTWHVANVTNLIISTESLTGANIEVRHAKNESSMNMDRCGTQASVILHNFAKVPWLKLRRDNSLMDSDLKIAAVNTKPMATEESGPDEERQTRLRRKKETLGMDDTLMHVVPEILSRTQLKHR